MEVELLWWDGCPSYPEALAELRQVLREEGLADEVELVEIESDEQAERERFPGSSGSTARTSPQPARALRSA
jgi:hypothetical protein